MAGNADYDALLSTTLAKYIPTLEDNVFTDRPLLDFLSRDGNLQKVDGGEAIIVPLLYGDNSTAKSYSGYDTLDITPQEGITAARFPWRQFATSVAISGIEEAKNNGDAAVLSLLKAKIMQAEESTSEAFDEMFFLDGTTANRDWYGLDLLVNDHTNSITDVGGIDCAVAGNEWWRSVVTDAASAVRTDERWATAFYSASRGNVHPNFAITTQTLFEDYETSLAPQLRFTSNAKADSRFMNLEFKGVHLYFDSYCQSGSTFFLNSKYIGLRAHSQKWFKSTGFKEAIDKDAKWSQLLSYGNMVTSNRSRHARVDAQTV